MKAPALAALLLLSSPCLAQTQPSQKEIDKQFQKYQVIATVSASQQKLWHKGDVSCTTDGGQTDCDVNSWNLPGVNRTGVIATMYAVIDGKRFILSCDAQWAWSYCRGLPDGDYHIQWLNREHTKLKLLYYFSGNKSGSFNTVKYDALLASAANRPPVSPGPPTKP